LFAGTRAHELNGSSSLVEVRGVPVWVSGVAVDDELMMEQAVSTIPNGAFKVFLYHYPDLIAAAAALKVDLYCAGHTQGGQIALPLYGVLITFSKYGKR
jgi:predicted MPP superfamily phosphohydrolase